MPKSTSSLMESVLEKQQQINQIIRSFQSGEYDATELQLGLQLFDASVLSIEGDIDTISSGSTRDERALVRNLKASFEDLKNPRGLIAVREALAIVDDERLSDVESSEFISSPTVKTLLTPKTRRSSTLSSPVPLPITPALLEPAVLTSEQQLQVMLSAVEDVVDVDPDSAITVTGATNLVKSGSVEPPSSQHEKAVVESGDEILRLQSVLAAYYEVLEPSDHEQLHDLVQALNVQNSDLLAALDTLKSSGHSHSQDPQIRVWIEEQQQNALDRAVIDRAKNELREAGKILREGTPQEEMAKAASQFKVISLTLEARASNKAALPISDEAYTELLAFYTQFTEDGVPLTKVNEFDEEITAIYSKMNEATAQAENAFYQLVCVETLVDYNRDKYVFSQAKEAFSVEKAKLAARGAIAVSDQMQQAKLMQAEGALANLEIQLNQLEQSLRGGSTHEHELVPASPTTEKTHNAVVGDNGLVRTSTPTTSPKLSTVTSPSVRSSAPSPEVRDLSVDKAEISRRQTTKIVKQLKDYQASYLTSFYRFRDTLFSCCRRDAGVIDTRLGLVDELLADLVNSNGCSRLEAIQAAYDKSRLLSKDNGMPMLSGRLTQLLRMVPGVNPDWSGTRLTSLTNDVKDDPLNVSP